MIYLDGRCSGFPLEKHCHALSDVLFQEEGGGVALQLLCMCGPWGSSHTWVPATTEIGPVKMLVADT